MKRAVAVLLLACMSLAAVACGVYGPPVRTPRAVAPAAAPEPVPEPATEELLDPPDDLDEAPDVP